MTPNEERYRWLIEQVWHRRNLAVLAEGVAADYLGHDPVLPREGRQGLLEMTRALHEAFTEIHYEIHETLGQGDTVAARWTMTGRHSGEFRGVPPTQRLIAVSGLSWVRFERGQMAEAWISYDGINLMRQLGVKAP
jgi:steroid delta-isomerase-like uncharacterized protein